MIAAPSTSQAADAAQVERACNRSWGRACEDGRRLRSRQAHRAPVGAAEVVRGHLWHTQRTLTHKSHRSAVDLACLVLLNSPLSRISGWRHLDDSMASVSLLWRREAAAQVSVMEARAESWCRRRGLGACVAAWRAAAAAGASKWESARRARKHFFLATIAKALRALGRNAEARARKRERAALADRHWARRVYGHSLWAWAVGAAMRRSSRIARLKAEAHQVISAKLRGWEAWLLCMAAAEETEREGIARGVRLRGLLLRPKCLRALCAWREAAAAAAVKAAKCRVAVAHSLRTLRIRGLRGWRASLIVLERRRRLGGVAAATRPSRLRAAGWGSWRAAVARGRHKAASFHAASLAAAFSRLQKVVGAWRAAVTRRRAALVFASHVASLNQQMKAGPLPLSRPESRARSRCGSQSRSRSRSPFESAAAAQAASAATVSSPPTPPQHDAPLPTLRGEGWGHSQQGVAHGPPAQCGLTWSGTEAERRASPPSFTSSSSSEADVARLSGSSVPPSGNQAVWDAVRRAESAGATSSGRPGVLPDWQPAQHSEAWAPAVPALDPTHSRGWAAAANTGWVPGAIGGDGGPRKRPAPRRPAILYDLSLPLTPNVAARMAMPSADNAASTAAADAAAALHGGSRGEAARFPDRSMQPAASQLGNGLGTASAAGQSDHPPPRQAAQRVAPAEGRRWQQHVRPRGAEGEDANRQPSPSSPLPPPPPPLSPRSAQAAGLVASELLGAHALTPFTLTCSNLRNTDVRWARQT